MNKYNLFIYSRERKFTTADKFLLVPGRQSSNRKEIYGATSSATTNGGIVTHQPPHWESTELF